MYNQNFNQQTWNQIPMPLIMGFTTATPIETDVTNFPIIYDPITQKIGFDMRVVGTYSLKQAGTKKGNKTMWDKKNEIDDQKNVK